MCSVISEDFLDSLFESSEQDCTKSKHEDAEQKCNKEGINEEKSQAEKNKQLDSGESAALETSQDSAEPKHTEDSAEPKDAEVSAELEDAEDSAESEDAEDSANNEDLPNDVEKNLHGDTPVESENRMKAPICLIENLANGKLVVNPEAINVLSKIKQPVVVVSIVGMYRTGKSYLMNKLAGAQKGFSLGSTVQSKTKGIWMWCVPHPKVKDHTLVLLDTEGLGDVEKGDSKNDTWLFSLALLLSSALVYNSKGTIDQDALDKLKFVGEVSNLIKVKTEKKKEENEDDFSTHFPIFIWTVRDFLLELIMDGKPITADEYMENALRLKSAESAKEMSKQDKEFNNVRNIIRGYFGKRKCFTFDLPIKDTKLFHKLEEVSDNQLCPDFVAQSKTFCDYVFKKANVKKLDVTIKVNGERLGEMAKIYTEAICTSKIACMEEVVVSLSHKENQIAVQEAVQYYQDKMNDVKLPTETMDEFFNVSRQYEEEARKMFMDKSLRDEDKRFLAEFMENLQNKKNEFYVMNEKSSWDICEALIKKHSADFEKYLLNGTFLKSGGHAKYKESLLTIEIEYNKESGKGVKGEEVLQDYFKSKKGNELAIIQVDNALSQREKEMAEEKSKQQTEEMEEKLKRMKEETKNKKNQEKEASLQQTIHEMEDKWNKEHKMMIEKLEEVKKEKEKEWELYMKEAAEKEARKYQQKIKELEELNRKKIEEMEKKNRTGEGNNDQKCKENQASVQQTINELTKQKRELYRKEAVVKEARKYQQKINELKEKRMWQIEEMDEKFRNIEEEYYAQKCKEEQARFQKTIKVLMDNLSEERKMMDKKLAEVLKKEKEREANMKEAAEKEARKYQQKINELKEKNRKQIEQMEEKIQRMEKENKAQKHQEERARLQQTIKEDRFSEERKMMDKKLAEVLKEKARELYMKEAAEKEARESQEKIKESN